MRLWALGKLDTDPPPSQQDDRFSDDARVDGLDESAALFGLRVVGAARESAADVFWLWPETVPYWVAWHQVQTQWRWIAGMASAHRVGLDYAGVSARLQASGWRHRRGRSLRAAMEAIAEAEREALDAWASKQQP